MQFFVQLVFKMKWPRRKTTCFRLNLLHKAHKFENVKMFDSNYGERNTPQLSFEFNASVT